MAFREPGRTIFRDEIIEVSQPQAPSPAEIQKICITTTNKCIGRLIWSPYLINNETESDVWYKMWLTTHDLLHVIQSEQDKYIEIIINLKT